jgi:hypothetical protein
LRAAVFRACYIDQNGLDVGLLASMLYEHSRYGSITKAEEAPRALVY